MLTFNVLVVDILGPNGTRLAHCHFRAQKSLDFQGPPPSIGLSNGFSRIKIKVQAPHKKQVYWQLYKNEFLYYLLCIVYSVMFVVSLRA